MENLDDVKTQIANLKAQLWESQGKQILQAYFNDILLQVICEMTNNDISNIRKLVIQRMQLRGAEQLENVDSAILDHWLRIQIQPD